MSTGRGNCYQRDDQHDKHSAAWWRPLLPSTLKSQKDHCHGSMLDTNADGPPPVANKQSPPPLLNGPLRVAGAHRAGVYKAEELRAIAVRSKAFLAISETLHAYRWCRGCTCMTTPSCRMRALQLEASASDARSSSGRPVGKHQCNLSAACCNLIASCPGGERPHLEPTTRPRRSIDQSYAWRGCL